MPCCEHPDGELECANHGPEARERLRVWSLTAQKAIHEASYALDPNQGERPDPTRAYMWLRTTYPTDHPNYVDPETLGRAGV